ncbi:hypothetical protein CAPTEDRAFT_226714 [Capitella teleta]|uniref:Ras-associating domain-containing protein n=1 Tax=Capitella teleta TaxID=283909 RepID=R7U3S6_CAPTE|nr:hypothetical protein CAPTEDRAFT_226714 [Capitella teleta]|eukprot:ELT97800.1 hypothetical protein CAPTEDRAFT_226714 [Capitella teleta]
MKGGLCVRALRRHTVSWDNTSHRTMGDPGALKFTAIKVRTSPVAPRKEPQIVVISNQTTTRDLITMVIKKCKMDASNAEIVDLLAEYRNEADTDAETETLLDDDRPLLIYDSQPKGTIRFGLAWKPEEHIVNGPNLQLQESEMTEEGGRNGCTLPGKGSVLPIRLHSPEERPEGEYIEVTASDCLVHYEPHTGSPASTKRAWMLSNGYNQHSFTSDSPLEYRLSVACSSSNGSPRTGRSDSALTDDCSTSTGADIYTSINGRSSSNCSSSSGDEKLRNPHSTSLPDMVGLVGNQLRLSNDSTRSTRSLPIAQQRRTLPKLYVSQEDVQQKQQSISAEFSKKLRQFMKTKKDERPPPPRAPPSELDETMSVTSMEVADILAGAAPPGLSDDEDDDEQNDETTTVCSDTETLDGDSEYDEENDPPPPLVEPPSAQHHRLSHFVEQSMESFLTNVTSDPKVTPHKGPFDPRQSRFPVTSHHTLEQRPVSVFTLIQNYALSDVVLTKQSHDLDSGLIFRDKMVSFQNFRPLSGSSEKSQSCILPCISSIVTSEGAAIQGSVLKGDLIIEVNGRSAFNMGAKHVTAFIDQSKDVEMVVARKRVYINKTTCTSPRSVAF